MGAIKRALEEREDNAREHLRVTHELVSSLMHGLESNKPTLVFSEADGARWKALFDALDDLEQIVSDFYEPMLSWADGDDDPEGGVADSTPRCDVCNAVDETVEWCGNCGCCVEHCQHQQGCEDYARFVETGDFHRESPVVDCFICGGPTSDEDGVPFCHANCQESDDEECPRCDRTEALCECHETCSQCCQRLSDNEANEEDL